MTSRLLRLAAPGIAMLSFLLNGCMHDRVAHRYTFQRPVYETFAQAHLDMKSGPAKDIAMPGKIALYKNYLFISDATGGIHVLDNKDPRNPVNLSFITLFGNSDIAIKNDVLYADDGYQELVSFDISDPLNIKAVNFIPRMFYQAPDSTGSTANAIPDDAPVLTGYVTVDTTVYGDNSPGVITYWAACANCETLASAAYASSSGQSGAKLGITGSTSRFAIHDNYLYALNGAGYLDVFDISTSTKPQIRKMTPLDGYYETLFSLNDHLFMGAALGVFIYDATDPLNITKSGSFSHVRSCDPVIAEGKYAFVTAWSGSSCGGGANELDVLDITSLNNPLLLDHYALTNPRGLAKDGDLLFICDGIDGFGSFKVSDGSKVVKLYSGDAMATNDVIAANGVAIVTAPDGIFQYGYDGTGKLEKLSKINLDAY